MNECCARPARVTSGERLIESSSGRGVVSSRQMRKPLLGFLAASVLVAGVRVAADDWPQFLGPTRNGVYNGPPLASSFPAGGPKTVWRKQVGQGFAGPVVAGERLILFHRVASEEIVEALNARTGAPCGDSPTRPPIATTSASTRGHARSRSW